VYYLLKMLLGTQPCKTNSVFDIFCDNRNETAVLYVRHSHWNHRQRRKTVNTFDTRIGTLYNNTILTYSTIIGLHKIIIFFSYYFFFKYQIPVKTENSINSREKKNKRNVEEFVYNRFI
jgi:hypothetical protein